MWPAVVVPSRFVPDPINALGLTFLRALYFVINDIIESAYDGVQDHVGYFRIANCGCWDTQNFHVDIVISIILQFLACAAFATKSLQIIDNKSIT